MSTLSIKPLPSLDVNKGKNGNLTGLIFAFGRQACEEGKSIFDCPYDIGSDQETVYMDGFMSALMARDPSTRVEKQISQ